MENIEFNQTFAATAAEILFILMVIMIIASISLTLYEVYGITVRDNYCKPGGYNFSDPRFPVFQIPEGYCNYTENQ